MMTTEATLPPFDRIDYKDHFRLVADTDRFESIEDFLKALALASQVG